MRFSQVCAVLLALAATASAADLTIKVIDPQGAAVSGAQLTLMKAASEHGPARHSAIAIESTSPEGLASFHDPGPGRYQVNILAKGFAAQTLNVQPTHELLTVSLKLAPAAETVVVTATRSPVPGELSGSQVESLSGEELESLQPVAASDLMKFLPGAVVNTAGQRGGLASLFVRGGDSTYNKVIVDGVTINEPGGTFDFGNLPLSEADHLEFVRGAQSTLYGSDAMTSVIQIWTRSGSTRIPELRFGADGGNFGTAHGYAAISGARGRFDYNLFGDQFNTQGQGVNDAYSNSLQGANVGVALTHEMILRTRFRHSNSFTGLPGEWNFNGQALEPPDPSEHKQLNNFLGSTELSITLPSGWHHSFSGFEYNYRYQDINLTGDAARLDDFKTHASDHINRAGFEYEGDYAEETWGHTAFGYRFEDENGVIGDLDFPPSTDGVRLNDDVYGEQQFIWKRLSAVAGARFIHNGAFGNTGVPRIAATLLALRGGRIFSGTRLRFSYAQGFKEPRLEEAFAGPPFSVPNSTLKPERTRAFETGFQQNLFQGRYSLAATYFNNLFLDRIDYANNPVTFIGQYVNVDKSFAHGAEVEFQGQLRSRLSLNTAYVYTSTQILAAPECTPANFCDPAILGVGRPLLRRPKHSATMSLSYLGTRWGCNLRGSFVGRRADSDFLNFGINHAPGYVRAGVGAWYVVNSRMTAYVDAQNILDRHYNEVVGYPALTANFRAGMRFRIGGE